MREAYSSNVLLVKRIGQQGGRAARPSLILRRQNVAGCRLLETWAPADVGCDTVAGNQLLTQSGSS